MTQARRPRLAGPVRSRSHLISFAFVALGIGAACFGGEREPPRIDVEALESGRWRITYELDAPAAAFRFQRPAQFYREDVWEVVTPGYRLGRADGWQTLEVVTDSTPQRTIVVEFEEYTANIPKEYELFQPFSDGAVALYTGHLYGRPSGPALADSGAPIRSIHLTPLPGTHAIVRGEIYEESFTWTDTVGDGTYIYIGTLAPIETSELVAIVDPGMPEWLASDLHADLPRLFATYAERFGIPLPWKPVVLYSFQDADGSAYVSSGGTLTGLIQMTLTGSAWRRPSPGARANVFQFLAHEAVHLWNGEIVKNPGDGASWMHEGSANAMARDVLLEFGIIDADRHRAERESAINECFLALAFGEGPIDRAHERGAFRLFYDCGELMAVWTEAARRQARPGDDLFSFWRDLLSAARGRDGRYDTDLYFETLAAPGVSDTVLQAMRRFLSEPAPIELAIQGLRDVGVPIEPGSGTPAAPYRQELARRAVAHLMAAACGRVSFRSGDPIVTDPVAGCPPFDRELRIHAIEGFRVGDQGPMLYDAVFRTCASAGQVTLGDEGGAVLGSVICEEPIPARPSWYELRGTRVGSVQDRTAAGR